MFGSRHVALEVKVSSEVIPSKNVMHQTHHATPEPVSK